MHQLPPDFEIRPHLDGHGLFLRDRLIALTSPTTSGQARLDLCLGTNRGHSQFVPHLEMAERYLAGWCRKWEARIRDLYL